MREEDLLSSIFGERWKSKDGTEYVMSYCDLCECFSIKCNDENCHGSSCNCGGCDKCGPAFDEFHKSEIHVKNYLKEGEKKIFDKIRQVKKHMKESLFNGERRINWKRLSDEGKLSKIDEELFKDELYYAR